MALRSCFSNSLARKGWEKLHVYMILCLRFEVRFSYALDFRTGKCSVLATRDKLPTLWFLFLVCETERGNTGSFSLENSLWKRLWTLHTKD
jgi:hypothetical protein